MTQEAHSGQRGLRSCASVRIGLNVDLSMMTAKKGADFQPATFHRRSLTYTSRDFPYASPVSDCHKRFSRARGPREILEPVIQDSTFSRRRSGSRFVVTASKAVRTDAGWLVSFRPGFVPAAAVIGGIDGILEAAGRAAGIADDAFAGRQTEAVMVRRSLIALKQCRV